MRVEQIPIGGAADPFDNVVALPGGRSDPDREIPEPDAEQVVPAEPALGPLIEEAARIVAGSISAVTELVVSALQDLSVRSEAGEADEESFDGEPMPRDPSPIGVAAGAAAGLTMQLSEVAIRATTSFAGTAGPMMSWITSPAVVRRGVADLRSRAEGLNDRWSQERPASEDAAASFARRLLPELTSAVLDQLDLTQIAIDHLDIDRIVDSIDLDAIVERVDIDAVIHRLDLAGIATEVIGEIDLPELIRESTGAVTSETVRTVRLGSAELDRLLGRVVDRLLRRGADGDGGSDGARDDEEARS